MARLPLVVLLFAGLLSLAGAADYPVRPITFIVPWGAGGGTDAVGRVMASLLERELGRPVNVVNRAGGNGVIGHTAIATARPDGYTIGILTVEIAMMHHQKLTNLTPASFTPLGLINLDPTAIQVRTDSPHRTLGDLLGAIRAQPGKLKASGTGQGGIWHVSLCGLLREQGIAPDAVVWVPSASNAAGLLDLVAGGVDLVPGSHPEGRSLIDAGKVRASRFSPTSLRRSTRRCRPARRRLARSGRWVRGAASRRQGTCPRRSRPGSGRRWRRRIRARNTPTS